MTARTVRPRDPVGDVHIAPFGEIGGVRDTIREFSCATIEAGAVRGENIDRAGRGPAQGGEDGS